MERLRTWPVRQFFGVVRKAGPRLNAAWWALVVARGVLPSALAIAVGWLIDAVQRGRPLGAPLTAVGVCFVLQQISFPLHNQVGNALGDRTAGWLHERLLAACNAPAGLAHLEEPSLGGDLSMARDFDAGISGPPLSVSMGFISAGFGTLLAGFTSACILFAFRWWAPFLLGGAWASTHVLLKESAVWKGRMDPDVVAEQRHADYAYRLAVDPPPAKELRLFGLDAWTVERFATRRRKLLDLSWNAMRMRQKSVLGTLVLIGGASVLVFWSLADAAYDGSISLGRLVVFAQAALMTRALGFGGFDWALQGAAQPIPVALGLEEKMAALGSLPPGTLAARGLPAREIRFDGVSFAYPSSPAPVLDGFDLTIPAGKSMAIVGQNGAGKTTLMKLLCRLYDPTGGAVRVDGTDLRDIDVDAWRERVTAVFQDFVRYELPARDNLDPAALASGDTELLEALDLAGAGGLAGLATVLSRGYEGGIDLSGGQWQRIALARALAAVRLGAGLVILDEPTAQLDVRGETEIFERILTATRGCTTVLISHRFSTVRHADVICVLEDGKVVELGSHDDLMARNGRYRTMFDLQASRFEEDPDAVSL